VADSAAPAVVVGFPVIEINVDDDQVEDRIDDALQYWQDYHFDGLQKIYFIKQIDQTDINNKYLNLAEARDSANNLSEITGVTRIFPMYDSQASLNMFDLRYQLRLNELYDFTSASYVNYTMTMQHLRMINPDAYGRVWNDRWLKEYATALIKRSWGNNLKKFAGVQLPGGVILNGDKIYNEAVDEIKLLEADMEKNYGGILDWYMN